MDGVTYRKNPLRDRMCMKSGEYSSSIRFSKWLSSCVFSDVGAVVLVEKGNELTKAGSEGKAWGSFDMTTLRSCRGGGAGRDGMAGPPVP